MPEFLLEVGCEEIPAGWLPGLTEQMRSSFVEIVTDQHLEPAEVAAFSTPRRLVLRAQVPHRQPDREERVRGPALQIAKDALGKNWTQAAHGFANRHSVTVDDLIEDVDPKVQPPLPQYVYIFAVKKILGRDTREVLPSVIASVLRSLAFPKRMNWDAWLDDGKGSFPFGRPIRWLVALLGGEVVPFVIHAMTNGAKGEAIVQSRALTFGHRFLPRGKSGGPILVHSFADLEKRLRESYVILDPKERERWIREGLLNEMGGRELKDDHGLIEEWRDLVEYPTVVGGRIPSEFHFLPLEVLQTVLVHHQKFLPLPVEGRVSRFAAVTNTDGATAADIVRGMEQVVVARLRDAAFFYQEDMKRPLAERVADLAGVTFHQGLGSYKDKSDRMVRLADIMGAEMGLLTKPEHEAAREAAQLAKADLTTLMVRDFPELQGVMGGIYLRAQGCPWNNVASAVQWHYHPLSLEEGSPPARSLTGGDATVFGAVSLADKLDSLAGYFGLGLSPSGSSDPYGLRRAAQGAVRVLLEFWNADAAEGRPSLRKLLAAAVEGYGDRLKRSSEEVRRDLEVFMIDRLRFVFISRGFPADEVEATLGAQRPDALDDPYESLLRLRALHRVRADAREDFEHLAVAFKRARNILEPGVQATVDPALFQVPAERGLHEAVARLQASDGDYEARLRDLAGLREPVDRFFDDVLVMAEDEKLRRNRLALLSQVGALFYRIADISKLGG